MNGRPWTREDLRWLRRFRRDNVPLTDIADVMGRSYEAVKGAVERHEMRTPRSRRLWTPEEDAVIRDEYRTTTARALADRLGRPLAGIYRRALILLGGGPVKTFRWKPSIVARVRRLNAQGLCDREIGERIGLDRDQVKAIRGPRLGLPTNIDHDAKRRGVQNQLKTLGLKSPTELRTRAFRLFAERRGWPSDLRPREVQILELLAGGPLTRRQLAERLGLRAIGIRNMLKSNSVTEHKTTYLSELMSRGLVVYQNQFAGCWQRLPGLYWLTLAALDVIINRANPKEDCNVENGTEHSGRRGLAAGA